MAKATREQIFKALFALVDNDLLTWETWDGKTAKFKTKSRRIKLFSDVSTAQQPWIGQAEHDEEPKQIPNQPYKRLFKAQWVIYLATGSDKATLSVDINNLLDTLDAALAPTPSDPGFQDKRMTLGGLVYHVYTDGRVFKDPGDIDNQGMIVYPINILVP